jgi:hypothetical protein
MGDTLHGLTVTRIEPLKLVLTSERGDQELQLFKPSAASAVGSGPSAQSPALTPASAKVATSQADTKTAASQGWKPGAPVELPASMQGLKVVDAPAPTGNAKIQKGRKVKQPSKVPRNP